MVKELMELQRLSGRKWTRNEEGKGRRDVDGVALAR